MDLDTLFASDVPLKRLARRLVDDALADDVAQEARLRRLQRSAGGWIGRAASRLRGLALDFRRAETRRRRRELAAARPEATPSAADVAEREEIRRLVLDAIAALDAPSRAVVLLRYYEGLPPRAVARRLGVPTETARTRLKRALKKLRDGLDARNGDDGDGWRMAFVAWAALPPPAGAVAAVVVGAAFMTKILAFGAAVLVAWFLWSTVRRDVRFTAVEPGAQPIAAERTPDAPAARPGDAGAIERRAFDDGLHAAAAGAPASRSAAALTVRVVRAEGGAPVAGAEVTVLRRRGGDATSSTATTDARCVAPFEVDAPSLLERVRVSAGSDWTATESAPRRRVGGEPVVVTVVVASGAVLSGRVRDAAGDPVPHATVTITSALGPPEGEDRGEARASVVVADAAGAWRAEQVGPWVEIVAEGNGRLAAVGLTGHVAAGSAVSDLVLIVDRPRTVAGRVVDDADGSPVAGARLELSSMEGRGRSRFRDLERFTPTPPPCASGPDGRFAFAPGAARRLALSAVAPGRPWWTSALQQVPEVEVRLGIGTPATLRCVGPDGEGIAGAVVRLYGEGPERDVTCDDRGVASLAAYSAGEGGYRLVRATAEGFGTAATVLPQALFGEVRVELPRERRLAGVVVDADGDPVAGAVVETTAEEGVRSSVEEVGAWIAPPSTTADPDGGFELRGLRSARVRVRAYSADAPWRRAEAWFDADAAPAVLRLGSADGGRLEIRVRDVASGAPIGRFSLRLRTPAQGVGATSLARDVVAVDGTFVVEGLPPARAHLQISAPGRSPWSGVVDVGEEAATCVEAPLTQLRTVRLRVEAPPDVPGVAEGYYRVEASDGRGGWTDPPDGPVSGSLAGGAAVLERMPPGPLRVEVFRRHAKAERKSFVVDASDGEEQILRW
ncbi:MAG TPA: sigma-70 family RNA polymerase sigma factor [Planctomycetota bacterium]|nr:sigma-70 family RNA polymerase sigma factor [Planctomycetota bacterium]